MALVPLDIVFLHPCGALVSQAWGRLGQGTSSFIKFKFALVPYLKRTRETNVTSLGYTVGLALSYSMNFNSGTCIAAWLLRKKGGLRCVRRSVGREDERGGRITDKNGRIWGFMLFSRPAHRSEMFLKENSWHVLR
jgi:hypothetical protein